MFRIAICDDEEYFLFREKNLIEKHMRTHGYSCIIDLYPSGKDLLKETETILQYDIVFLDINMSEMDGIKTARKIREISAEVYIVFVSAYISYSLEGYKVNAIRYILKEDESLENSLNECLDTITQSIDNSRKKLVFDFTCGKRSIFIDSILYIESRLHKVIFYVMEDKIIKEYSIYDKLSDVEQELKTYGFMRIHQSFLANMKYAAGVERYKLSLKTGGDINISKKYYKKVEMEYIRQKGDI